ncbi:MAG: hypothetical protein CFH01_01413, partial [Alphaproteobacteria bacterium MarineAlpha2_Bin1]
IIKNILSFTFKNFKNKHGEIVDSEFAIIGLGTLGSNEMQFRSDLDLIFIYENKKNIKESNGINKLPTSKYFARLSQQFISAITSLTSEGRIFEIDMRLRPSGNSGPIATSIESFEQYHDSSSWTWEKMALTRAKPIAGDKMIIDKINLLLKKILSKQIPQEILLNDILSMRERIKKQYNRDKWQIKNSPGGLLDIQFLAQYLQLLYSSNHTDILDQKIKNIFINLKERNLLNSDIADNIIEISDMQFNLHAIISLCFKDTADQTKFSDEISSKLINILNVKNKFELNLKLGYLQNSIINYFNTITNL